MDDDAGGAQPTIGVLSEAEQMDAIGEIVRLDHFFQPRSQDAFAGDGQVSGRFFQQDFGGVDQRNVPFALEQVADTDEQWSVGVDVQLGVGPNAGGRVEVDRFAAAVDDDGSLRGYASVENGLACGLGDAHDAVGHHAQFEWAANGEGDVAESQSPWPYRSRGQCRESSEHDGMGVVQEDYIGRLLAEAADDGPPLARVYAASGQGGQDRIACGLDAEVQGLIAPDDPGDGVPLFDESRAN